MFLVHRFKDIDLKINYKLYLLDRFTINVKNLPLFAQLSYLLTFPRTKSPPLHIQQRTVNVPLPRELSQVVYPIICSAWHVP